MSHELLILSLSALSLGFLHTLFGPDHYVPFVALSKACNWSKRKTVMITITSGLGHILGSIILGLFGVAIGIALNIIEEIEAVRGIIAGWSLIIFGAIYSFWGVYRLVRNHQHSHFHTHLHKIINTQGGTHEIEYSLISKNTTSSTITTWVLFIIFVFGPCEVLIPLLIYPASNIGISGIAFVTLLFALATIITMTGMVIFLLYGINYFSFSKFDKYSHVFAGIIIVFSGLAIQLLGL